MHCMNNNNSVNNIFQLNLFISCKTDEWHFGSIISGNFLGIHCKSLTYLANRGECVKCGYLLCCADWSRERSLTRCSMGSCTNHLGKHMQHSLVMFHLVLPTPFFQLHLKSEAFSLQFNLSTLSFFLFSSKE